MVRLFMHPACPSRRVSARLSIHIFRSLCISPISRARKPTNAVVKPNPEATTGTPHKQKTSPTRKSHEQHEPRLRRPSHKAALRPLKSAAASSTANEAEEPHLSSESSPAHASSTPVYRKQTNLQPSGYARPATYAAQLADSKTPTVLYSTQSQVGFIATCYTTSLFAGCCGYINYGYISVASTWWSTTLFSITAGAYLVFSWWFAYAPMKVIRKITAMPNLENGSASKKPTLELEVLQVLPGLKFKPLRIKTDDLVGSQYAENFVAVLAGTSAGTGGRPAPPEKGVFGAFRNIFSNFSKMFFRNYMTKMLVTGHGTYKLDCDPRRSFLLDHGQALDKLIEVRPQQSVSRLLRAALRA